MKLLLVIWAIVSMIGVLASVWMIYRKTHPKPCDTCKNLIMKNDQSYDDRSLLELMYQMSEKQPFIDTALLHPLRAEQGGKPVKFKDKNGNMFEFSVAQHVEGMCIGRHNDSKQPCYGCSIGRGHIEVCKNFANRYPAEAARLMGYEVVEEVTDRDNQKSDCNYAQVFPDDNKYHCIAYSYSKREDGLHRGHYPYCGDDVCPVKHPELLEGAVLEEIPAKQDKPLTRFDQIKDCETPEDMVIVLNGNERRFCPRCYGRKQEHCDEPCGKCIVDWLRGTDKLRFTALELADAIAIRRLHPDAHSIRRGTSTTMPLFDKDGFIVGHISSDLFPSIKVDRTVKLSDIVGGEASA